MTWRYAFVKHERDFEVGVLGKKKKRSIGKVTQIDIHEVFINDQGIHSYSDKPIITNIGESIGDARSNLIKMLYDSTRGDVLTMKRLKKMCKVNAVDE